MAHAALNMLSVPVALSLLILTASFCSSSYGWHSESDHLKMHKPHHEKSLSRKYSHFAFKDLNEDIFYKIIELKQQKHRENN